MLMQKIETPAVSCNLFDTVKGWTGTGTSSNAPRAAGEDEARAYADFIRRKNNLPEIGRPVLHSTTIRSGRAGHFYYIGATFGEKTASAFRCPETRRDVPAQYEPGAFSVLFPGANMMRAAVTLETLDDAGAVISSQTMPIEPKKGGAVWSKDDVRKACGPIAKVKAARTAPTVAKRRAGPTMDKRRRAIMLALRLRKQLRISRDIAHDRLRQLAENSRQNAAEHTARPDMPAAVPDAILSDLVAAERLIRGEGYVAPRPLSMRAAFGTLYRIARRDKLAGADLLHAACDLTGEPREAFKCWRAGLLYTAVTRALEQPEGMRYRLQRNVLNAWGARHGLRSPAMDSPRFEGWRRVSCQADALRKRLADAGRLEYDAGNWVSAILPLPVTPEAAPTSLTSPERPYAGLFRPCSGQSRKGGKRHWGICLARDGVVPWWRHQTENGRTALYGSFEAAQKAIAKLERGPLPEVLAAKLAEDRAARAAQPERVKTAWHDPSGLTCQQCAVEGREAPAYPGPEFRVRVLLPGYDGAEGKVVPWTVAGWQTWHILTDAGQRITWYAEDEGESWEKMSAPTVDEPEAAPTAIQAKRTPAHERAIRRAWAERKAARAARFNVALARDMAANNKRAADFQRERADALAERVDALEYQSQQDRNAKIASDNACVIYRQRQGEAEDAQRLAESIAEDHMRMREELQRVLADAERRLAAAEAENAQLWAEIEALTAPQPALAA